MTDEEEIDRAIARPCLDDIPIYKDFIENHSSYERIHIHLIGIRPKEGGTEGGLRKKRNLFNVRRVVDAVADPYVTVEVVGGDETGSTNYFPIGKHTFPVLKDIQAPLWDQKCVLLCKKGASSGIHFVMKDENRGDDTVLLEFTLDRSSIEDASSGGDANTQGWIEFVETADTQSEAKVMGDLEFVFRVRITDCDDEGRIVSPEDMDAIYADTEERTYTEEILVAESGEDVDNALLQCWKHETSTRAVLWVLGRNDCFMHPHVANGLFFNSSEEGGDPSPYDLYVLNYRSDGHCRKKGWVKDPELNSHNRQGDFDVYLEEIGKALDIMAAQKDYQKVIGYAHSTGGPVLLDYIMEKGDAAFDGFIFNSPFLDWGYVGGDTVEFLLENVGVLEKLGVMPLDKKLGTATTPEELKDTPLLYMGKEVVLCDWSARVWSLYYFDWRTRPLFKTPMTVGFAKGVTAVHKKMEEKFHKRKRAMTTKPFLCITSRGDDVLRSSETVSRADWIGPGRCEVELRHNAHDVFLSQDERDTIMALDMTKSWMKCYGFF